MHTRMILDLAKIEGKAQDGGPPLSDADKAFLADMLGHHKEALKMVSTLGASKNAAVKALAASIKEAQTGEIATMKKLLGTQKPPASGKKPSH